MAIRQSADRKRIFLRQRDLPARWTDLVRRHMGGPSSSDPLGDAGDELGTGRLPLRGEPIGHGLLRLGRRYEAEERGRARSGRRSRVSQPDLVLLLVWVQEKANIYAAGTNANARAANGDTTPHGLSSTTNRDTATLSCTTNGDDDSHLDAHLSGYAHGHSATLVEQFTNNVPERNASQGVPVP